MKLDDGYILGLVEGEGSFTFSTKILSRTEAKIVRKKVPAFMLQMHERDFALIVAVRDYLGLKNRVYNYLKPALVTDKKIYIRGRLAMLTVREIGSLKNIIVPFFVHRLIGHKRVQFLEWIEEIGNNPEVPESYKIIYRLYKSGYYSRQ
ncbi:MAG: LAGLIDADG family homing endonuclease [Patescibacteria group bacterium]